MPATAWIVEVLSDIKRFAEMNGLPRLAQELEATLVVARTEAMPRGHGAHLRKTKQDQRH